MRDPGGDWRECVENSACPLRAHARPFAPMRAVTGRLTGIRRNPRIGSCQHAHACPCAPTPGSRPLRPHSRARPRKAAQARAGSAPGRAGSHRGPRHCHVASDSGPRSRKSTHGRARRCKPHVSRPSCPPSRSIPRAVGASRVDARVVAPRCARRVAPRGRCAPMRADGRCATSACRPTSSTDRGYRLDEAGGLAGVWCRSAQCWPARGGPRGPTDRASRVGEAGCLACVRVLVCEPTDRGWGSAPVAAR